MDRVREWIHLPYCSQHYDVHTPNCQRPNIACIVCTTDESVDHLKLLSSVIWHFLVIVPTYCWYYFVILEPHYVDSGKNDGE
jgi:hypothetical protein